MSPMDPLDYTRAPRWRQGAATLVDVAVLGGMWWLARSRGWVRDGGALGKVLAAPGEPLREQLRSPGQLLLGIRTVDRRTGRRLALWRTLALAGAGAAGQVLTQRVLAPEADEQARRREAFGHEQRALMKRHPEASPERDAERRALVERYPNIGPNVLRTAAPMLAVGLVQRRLRTRLAPTVDVLARGSGRDHSP